MLLRHVVPTLFALDIGRLLVLLLFGQLVAAGEELGAPTLGALEEVSTGVVVDHVSVDVDAGVLSLEDAAAGRSRYLVELQVASLARQ